MTTSAARERSRGGLGPTLERELAAARTRVEKLAERRRQLERSLEAALAAERAARQAFEAVQAIADEAAGAVPGLVVGGAQDVAAPQQPRGADRRRLAGSELREMAARVALRRQAHGRPVHWREWLGWLHEEGLDAAGKKPDATFLTQLARSPMVRRTAQDGVYALDVDLFVQCRERLLELHGQLAQVPPAEQLAMLGDARQQRRALENEIARAERAVEEMWRVLTAEIPPGWREEASQTPERVVDAWLQRDRPGQERLG
jgi:hypothetical protein